jgi:hypothetical protein
MRKPKTKTTKKHTSKVLPSVLTLTRNTWFELITFWRPLALIVITYLILYVVFVLGFNIALLSIDSVSSESSRLNQSIEATILSIGSNLGASEQSDAASLVQFLLFMVSSLAFVWTLRRLQGLKKFKIREAYYSGNANIIPAVITSFLLLLLLIPAAIGTFIFSTVLYAANTSIQLLVGGLISSSLVVLSVYLFVVFWPAFYISTLPNSWPVQSLKDAKKITKHHRLSLLRKLLFIGFILFLLWAVIMILIGLIQPVISPYISFLIGFIFFAFSHTYLYLLYKELL